MPPRLIASTPICWMFTAGAHYSSNRTVSLSSRFSGTDFAATDCTYWTNMAYPDACIYVLGPDEIKQVPYLETEHYLVTRGFLANPQRTLDTLLSDACQ